MDWMILIFMILGCLFVSLAVVVGVCLLVMEYQWRREAYYLRRIGEMMNDAEKR